MYRDYRVKLVAMFEVVVGAQDTLQAAHSAEFITGQVFKHDFARADPMTLHIVDVWREPEQPEEANPFTAPREADPASHP